MSDKKVAVVTGAGKGIGLEVVKQLGKKGFLVYLTARNQAAGEKSADSLRKSGADVRFLTMDVANLDSIERAAREFGQENDRLDVLVNNAGILLDDSKDVMKEKMSDFVQTFETNSVGPLLVARAFLPYLKKGKGGRVINVSSGAGSLTDMSGYAPAYSVSKAALNAITKQMASALQSDGIAVNSVCPGWVRTDMGGSEAPRSVEEGASGIVWLAAEAPQKTTGRFLRDGKEVAW